MGKTISRAAGCLAKDIRSLKDDIADELPATAGFSFSAWFFVTVVALSFLDAYFLNGKGIETYFSVPTDVLAHSRSMVNI